MSSYYDSDGRRIRHRERKPVEKPLLAILQETQEGSTLSIAERLRARLAETAPDLDVPSLSDQEVINYLIQITEGTLDYFSSINPDDDSLDQMKEDFDRIKDKLRR